MRFCDVLLILASCHGFIHLVPRHRIKPLRSSWDAMERVVNIETNDDIMELAQTSSYGRPGKPKGVLFVVLYMSIFEAGHTAALDAMNKIATENEDCNFGRACTQFKASEALYSARGITTLPAFEVIAEGKRISLTPGINAGLAEVNRQLEAYGFVSTIKAQMEVSLTLMDEEGNSVPLGWRRDTETNRIVSVKDSGQAARAGVKPGWLIVAVDDSPVDSDDDYEAWVALARKDNKDGCITVRFELTEQVKPSTEKMNRDGTKIDYFKAQSDTQASGNFQGGWTASSLEKASKKPLSSKNAQAGQREVGRLTSRFFPGSEAANKAAEKMVENVESMFTEEQEGGVEGEDEEKQSYWEKRGKNLGKKKKK
mmetsp:Transcript_31150/g.42211  ORF Transcript_31150/g.42211 Transcript_31150/m.42211 type:complete len:369 (-) Transcript_31150:84-1190(-)|eukprot:CAMPEP_0185756866 /NCGR_PEP_ID=MMETSP1174-20130828/15259_1 /TAXON_ID=35687 /ORGANISM="Dictyocha speculum, Strain CCMP1381" /LENGTH=368 /DNA_ID=CAMNT_0028436005 /DNA_START=95 /DNA_END=1201 /DNA_ORIENTATION=+